MGMKLGTPFIGASLQRLFRLQGNVNLELEPFVLGTVQVADLTEGAAPPVTRAAMGSALQAAVAGELFCFRFEVPPSIIARIDRFSLMMGVPSVGLVDGVLSTEFAGTVAAANAGTVGWSDTRLPGGPAANLLVDTQVAGVTTILSRFPHEGAFGKTIELAPKNWYVGSDSSGIGGVMAGNFSIANTEARITMEWTEFQLT